LKNSIKIIASLIIAIVLVWVIFLFVDFDSIVIKLKQANPALVFGAIVISLVAHLIRAYRWKLLLQPLGHNPSLKHLFIAVMTAYFGNIFIPRGGEVMRCAVLNRSDKVPFSTSFATVVAERIFDFICLLILVGLAFILEYERFLEFFETTVFKKADTPSNSPSLSIILLLVVVVGAVLFFVLKKHFLKIVFIEKIYEFVMSLFRQAIDSFRLLKKKKEFLLHTFLIWLGYYTTTYMIFFALPFTSHLDVMAGLVILIVGGLGMSAPASGGIGPFHIMVAGALTLFYGLTKDNGIAYAFVLHTSQLIAMFVVGGICALWSLYLGKKESTITESSK